MARRDHPPEDGPLLQASVADLLLLQRVFDSLSSEATFNTAAAELAVVAPHSGSLWSALGRISIVVAYTAIERIVGTFARDRVLDLASVVHWLQGAEEPEEKPRIPEYRERISASKKKGGQGSPEYLRLEAELSNALSRAGLRPDQLLLRRIVALKKLRNECVHVLPNTANPARDGYLVSAGFAHSAVALKREDVLVALRTLEGVIQLFSSLWASDRWSGERLNIMSDLPIYVQTLMERVERMPRT